MEQRLDLGRLIRTEEVRKQIQDQLGSGIWRNREAGRAADRSEDLGDGKLFRPGHTPIGYSE